MPYDNKELHDKVSEHDKALTILTYAVDEIRKTLQSMERIAKENQEYFKKIVEIEEGFKAHKENKGELIKRIEKLENCHVSEKGCQANSVLSEKVTVANNRIKDLENWQTWAMRIIIGSVIVGILSYIGLKVH